MVAESLAVSDGNFSRAIEMLASCAVATHRGSIGQAIAVTTPDQFTNLSDNYLWSDGLNTSFSQAGLALPQPPYQPNWPEFFDGAVDNRTVKGHPGYLPDGPAGGTSIPRFARAFKLCSNISHAWILNYLCEQGE